ncbi:MAG: cupin domain-containing protein [Campylobacterota bacterium]
MQLENIFTAERINKGVERFDTLLQTPHVKIQKIQSNEFQNGNWYNQSHDEWVVLLRGSATLELQHQTLQLQQGDSLHIKKFSKHRVVQTSSDALWLAVHIGKE